MQKHYPFQNSEAEFTCIPCALDRDCAVNWSDERLGYSIGRYGAENGYSRRIGSNGGSEFWHSYNAGYSAACFPTKAHIPRMCKS